MPRSIGSSLRGRTITLAGAIHPWSNAINQVLPDFTRLTGISVITDFRLETTYLGALPVQLARGSSTPDVFMFTTYGQGISAGWLEPLNAHYSDRSLTDRGWYDESDLLKTARAFPQWSDGERYAFPITSEAMTMFINNDALAARNLPVPQTFEELLATAKAVKTNEMSGIAMRAQAGGNSSPPAMGFVFSFGGAMVRDNKADFASPEAIAAVETYAQLLSQTGPVGVGNYEWYHVLDDFLQARTAMAIDSSNFATDISNPAKSRVAMHAGFAAFPHVAGRAPVPFMSHWQACINAKSRNKRAAFLFLLWATSKPNLAADRRGGAGNDARVGLVQRGLQARIRRAGCGGSPDQLAKCRCRAREGDPFPSAIETHPRCLHDRRQRSGLGSEIGEDCNDRRRREGQRRDPLTAKPSRRPLPVQALEILLKSITRQSNAN